MTYLVSACLAGRPCRYDGSHCGEPLFEEMVRAGEALPFCPELLGGLPTPREPAEIRQCGGETRIFSRSGRDLTAAFGEGVRRSLCLAAEKGAVCGILKDRSPSCGFGRIYDGSFGGRLIPGRGVAAESLLARGLFLFNERDYAAGREVRLRKAREEELAPLTTLSREAFLEDAAAHSPYGAAGPQGFDDILWHREAARRGKLCTIRLAGVLVGGLFYTVKSDRSAWINRVFVKPGYQGRGIGRRAFFLLERRYPRVTEWGLDTPEWAVHNQSFYQSMGYRFSRRVFCREAGFHLMVFKRRPFPGALPKRREPC